MSKIPCEIIRDLLPSYIDGLTSHVTNKAIEEHMKDCSACEEALQQMRAPEIELPEIDIGELRLAAQERRSQLPLHKLKEKLANGDASDDNGEASEEAAEAEAAAEEAAEPIVEAPFIFEELPEEEAAAVEALETELAEAAEEAAEAASAAEPAQEAETDGFAEPAGSETEDAEDVVKV